MCPPNGMNKPCSTSLSSALKFFFLQSRRISIIPTDSSLRLNSSEVKRSSHQQCGQVHLTVDVDPVLFFTIICEDSCLPIKDPVPEVQ